MKRFVDHFVFSLIVIGLLSGCKPKLPTKPPFYLSLAATVRIEGKVYPVSFTLSEENYVAWNEGFGWHTEWKSSDRAFVRILDDNYAIAVWLPSVVDSNLDQFHPTFALMDRGNSQFLRTYPDLETAERRDEVFQIVQLKIQRSAASLSVKPMTKEEEKLKKDISSRKYGYLYGMAFHKEQWSRSQELFQLLGPLKSFTPLGKPPRPESGKELPEVWRAFYRFNAGIAMSEKMDRHLFGFEFRDGSWTPLPYPGVYWYRERLKEDPNPIWISYRGHRIDQQQHELFFDETTQQLVIAWRYGLESVENER